uniref:Serpentine receptor class gamma n=1 Tax=Rhabditophanes sp. KR3021 TaxID=114890 RepID=A0AC35UG61_9BILA
MTVWNVIYLKQFNWDNGKKARLEKMLFLYSFRSFVAILAIEAFFAMRFIAGITFNETLGQFALAYYAYGADIALLTDIPFYLLCTESVRNRFFLFLTFRLGAANRLLASTTRAGSNAHFTRFRTVIKPSLK